MTDQPTPTDIDHFVPATESPIRNPLLCVDFEISGTVGGFEVTPVTDR